jgi:predicted DNA-binding protein
MARQQIGGPRRHVILSKPQDEKLVKLAKKTGITTSEHIRRALDMYFRALELSEKRTNG